MICVSGQTNHWKWRKFLKHHRFEPRYPSVAGCFNDQSENPQSHRHGKFWLKFTILWGYNLVNVRTRWKRNVLYSEFIFKNSIIRVWYIYSASDSLNVLHHMEEYLLKTFLSISLWNLININQTRVYR